MKILSAKFVTSVTNIRNIPRAQYPEIAFAGRSNVGKSSLINTLINRKKLALTSSAPGKTRMINFYSINDDLYFVDLPGYGFAKVSKKERERWKILIESYIKKSAHLKGIVQLIDSRIGPTELDLEMISWLMHVNKPILIVATKTDKLPRTKLQGHLSECSARLQSVGQFDIIPFSTVNKTGKKEIWQAIRHLLEANKI